MSWINECCSGVIILKSRKLSPTFSCRSWHRFFIMHNTISSDCRRRWPFVLSSASGSCKVLFREGNQSYHFHSIFWVPQKIDAMMCVTQLHTYPHIHCIFHTRVNRLKAHALSHPINVQFFSDFGHHINSPVGIHVFKFDSEFFFVDDAVVAKAGCRQFNGLKMNGGWKICPFQYELRDTTRKSLLITII